MLSHRAAPLRWLVVVSAGLGGALLTYLCLTRCACGAADFAYPLLGAQRLLAGLDPYARAPDQALPDPLYYPLPSVLLAIPFTALPPTLAASAFVGLSSLLLAYGLTRQGYRGLWLFASPAYLMAANQAQWSPLVVAGATLPWLPIALFKPNLGGAVALAHPSRRALASHLALGVLSLLILPSWPLRWLENLRESHHVPPLLIGPGVLLLLAGVAWRRADGRLLLLCSAAPQLLYFYDQLALWLIPATTRQAVLLTTVSWAGYFAWGAREAGGVLAGRSSTAALWAVTTMYLPALLLVLYNEWLRWRMHRRAPAAVALA